MCARSTCISGVRLIDESWRRCPDSIVGRRPFHLTFHPFLLLPLDKRRSLQRHQVYYSPPHPESVFPHSTSAVARPTPITAAAASLDIVMNTTLGQV
jgi:hypothetical protein